MTEYHCSNFDSEEKNLEYLKETIMNRHESLPIGEFAIGTNTTAYAVSEKYGIGDQLPVLIAEKMGPHFAVGDTCYSWGEDCPVYNPDGERSSPGTTRFPFSEKKMYLKLTSAVTPTLPCPIRNWELSVSLRLTEAKSPLSRMAASSCRERKSSTSHWTNKGIFIIRRNAVKDRNETVFHGVCFFGKIIYRMISFMIPTPRASAPVWQAMLKGRGSFSIL